MREQNNKVIGIIALILSLIVVIPLGFIWHVLPAVLLMTFFGAILASATWALMQGLGGYKLHLLICTIVLFIAAHTNSRKLENKLDEINDDET